MDLRDDVSTCDRLRESAFDHKDRKNALKEGCYENS